MPTGLRTLIDTMRGIVLGDGASARSRRMALLNRVTRTPVTGDGPVVSLTTHGDRVRRVHMTIETIARGAVRPAELVLWLDDPAVVARPPRTLRRLQRRGLQVRLSQNYGPHTKYYPYLLAREAFDRPLVTADDDMLYPVAWLADLADAHRTHPDEVLCHRARRVQLRDGRIEPYLTWPLVGSTEPSPLNFATGVSGALYPPRFLIELKSLGSGFLDACPRADDVWLHWAAVRAGYSIRQIDPEAKNYPTVPQTQDDALQDDNVLGGGNDAQIAATYTGSVIRDLLGA
ncbi:hypothetical protein ACFWN7_16260 [Agromyces sp. NPDC058484]|uniref:hypothetical protein n=1 Tax=Agromyces sp. NPDC058484 TaxID=3346524 RepID=UPI003657F253